MKKNGKDTLYKVFIYVILLLLAISIIVPVGWVFLASIKENSEFYGNPRTLSMRSRARRWENICLTP